MRQIKFTGIGRYPVAYVREIREHCDRIGVRAPASFWRASMEELAAAFNGVGPDRWCPVFRSAVSWLLKPFFTAALPHDWEYSQPEKSYLAFTAANWRFAVNSWIEALDERRPGMIFMGLALAVLCQVFGWGGYLHGGTGHDD